MEGADQKSIVICLGLCSQQHVGREPSPRTHLGARILHNDSQLTARSVHSVTYDESPHRTCCHNCPGLPREVVCDVSNVGGDDSVEVVIRALLGRGLDLAVGDIVLVHGGDEGEWWGDKGRDESERER